MSAWCVEKRSVTVLDFHYRIIIDYRITIMIHCGIFRQFEKKSCQSNSCLTLFIVCFVSVLANKVHSRFECREVERESITVTVQVNKKTHLMSFSVLYFLFYNVWQVALRCVTVTYYDKARTVREETEFRDAVLFSWQYHMCIINTLLLSVLVTANPLVDVVRSENNKSVASCLGCLSVC